MKRYHFIGIGGIGMSALAHLLLEKQTLVSGSDLLKNAQTDRLMQHGAWVVQGHSAKHIRRDETVVYSSAVKPGNPEYEAALSLKCPVIHRSALLADLMQGYTKIAVTGTHGKTTTSALLTHILQHAQLDPSFAIGGLLQGSNSHSGTGSQFIFEADESDGTFELYQPHYAIFTNVEAEHLDHYGSLDNLHAACRRFCDRVERQLIICGDDPFLTTLLRSSANSNANGITYGFNPRCAVVILETKQCGFMQVVTLRDREGQQHRFELPLIGRHHACNAAAVFTLARQLGIAPAIIFEGMKTFPGVGRRMERKGEQHQVLMFDDYAHHPTEIKTTLEGLKEAIQERRLVVLFQPHRYTRLADLFDSFVTAFESADVLFITDLYGAGETPIAGIDAQHLVAAIQATSSLPCTYLSQWSSLNDFLRPHDVFISMGAGDITTVHADLNPHKKYTVGLFFGGRSCEHEISVRSSHLVREALDPTLYTIEPFFIDKQGKWSRAEGESADSLLHPTHAQRLSSCEICFPILHGSYGEDGTIQGLFEMLDKPYIGSDWAASALCMNKMHSKILASSQGVSTPHARSFTRREWQHQRHDWLTQLSTLHFPLFVKPNHLGSSVGISKVVLPDDLAQAIDYAFEFDTEVMVEEGIVNAREFEFAVMGNHNGFSITVPMPGEKLAQGAFVDYTLKYSAQPVPTTVDPLCPQHVLEAGSEAAYKVYQAIGCSGLTRVDFLLDSENRWWFFELNSIPGMTPLSLFPKIWKREGVSYSQLIDRLLILALDKTRERQRHLKPCPV